MAVEWPVGVNADAYGMDTSPIENVERIQFESGKERTYLKNSRGLKQHTFLIDMDDSGASSEYKTFVDWYNDTLLTGALTFNFTDLIELTGTKEYRLLDFSTTGQKTKEVSITVVEV